jgi:hypothetical protein
MGRNTGNGSRVGAVKSRTQSYNAKTGKYVKRDTETGRFLSSKDTPYKGVTSEESAKTNKDKLTNVKTTGNTKLKVKGKNCSDPKKNNKAKAKK